MRTLRLALAFVTVLAAPLSAQRAIAYEGGVLVQYTKFDDFTKLKSAVGLGGHFDVYILRRLALEYEGDFGSTTSSRLGKLTALNNRIDLVYNQPLNDKWRFLIGGGFTGTQYKSDTTKNQYDSGGNAVLGFRYCVNDNWSWKGEGVADFKDPSDQTRNGERTVTYGVRGGINYFFGGQAKNGPCLNARPAPPPPPPPAPAPAPPPAPTAASLAVTPPAATITVGGTQQYTATVRDGQGNVMSGQNVSWATANGSVASVSGTGAVRGLAAGSTTVTATSGNARGTANVTVNAPAPPPPPPPAPAKPRELFTLHGVHFEFDKAVLTKSARDTLAVAVRYLKEHGDARVELQGHTDSKGSDDYNMKLSERRAEAVKAYLATQGIAASRMSTRGFGESQPVADNETNGKDNPKGRAENRRAVIIEVP